MTITNTHAEVSTDRPARYGKQLVAHLGRRNGGEWSDDDATGWIDLGAGRVSVSGSDGVLHLRVDAESEEVARLEDVVGRHLVRFGTHDELTVQWTRADGAAGSTQVAP